LRLGGERFEVLRQRRKILARTDAEQRVRLLLERAVDARNEQRLGAGQLGVLGTGNVFLSIGFAAGGQIEFLIEFGGGEVRNSALPGGSERRLGALGCAVCMANSRQDGTMPAAAPTRPKYSRERVRPHRRAQQGG
jgi:hypothetical protein